jgi:RimJ/RimL family protein N-acetyltransferase
MNDDAIQIRPLHRGDFATVIGWFADEAALVQWGGPAVRFPLDERQLQQMLDDGQGQPPPRLLWVGAVDGLVVAHCQVACDWRHGVARLARVCVDPVRRGQKIAQRFLRAVVDVTFRDPAFERMELNVYTFNHAAIAVYRSLGFVPEGVRRSAVRVGAERWDSAIYGLLRSEHAPSPVTA